MRLPRHLAKPIGVGLVSAAIAADSFVLAPRAWFDRIDRRWTVVVSSMLALPVLWFSAPAMPIGVLPDVREHLRSRREAAAVAGETVT